MRVPAIGGECYQFLGMRNASAGRLVLPQSPSRWRDELLATGLIEYPIDGEIGIFAVALEGLHKDPADGKLLQWQHSLNRHDAAQ